MGGNIRKGAHLRKDPSGTKRQIRDFEDYLVDVFERVKRQLLDDLGLRLMALGDSNTTSRVDDAAARIVATAESRVKQNAVRAALMGKAKSVQFLNSSGFNIEIQPGDRTPLDAQALRVLEQRNLLALQEITDEMAKRIKSELSEGILKGEGSDELARRIERAVDDIGIVRAVAMARTETMYAFNTAAVATYKANGVQRVEWLAAADDGRLCEDCADLDSNTYDIGDAPPMPFHVNCRCTFIPVVEMNSSVS